MYQECISSFESIANFGSARAIQEAKNEVIKSIEESYDLYSKLNQSRNPLFGLETYIIPLTVGFVSAVLRWITDFTCSSWSQTCAVGSEVLSHIYQVVFFFLVIIAFTKSQQIRESATKMKKAFDVMNDDGGKKKKD
jgi:atlastin